MLSNLLMLIIQESLGKTFIVFLTKQQQNLTLTNHPNFNLLDKHNYTKSRHQTFDLLKKKFQFFMFFIFFLNFLTVSFYSWITLESNKFKESQQEINKLIN